MAVELAVAYVSLVPSAKGMRSAIEQELGVDDIAKSQGKKAGQGFVGAFNVEAGKLQDVGKKMAVAGAAIGVGLFAAAGAAGNLNAALAANEQVLGDASKAVQEWADDSVEGVGLSKRAALEAATSFGQLAKVAGKTGEGVAGFSTEMVEAAADLAAFKDVPVDQALADLQSGFAGSTEVLRKYGIFLDDASLKQAYMRETGEEVTGVLTAQQRVVATHSEIVRQGADMWGQWARESDGLAAQQSKLKAELENMGAQIGAAVLPAVTSLTGGLASAFGTVNDLNSATGGLVSTFATASAGSLALGGGFVFAVGKVAQLRQSIAALSTTAKVGAGLLAALPVAIVAGQFAYDFFTRKQREIDQRAREVADSLAAQVQATIDAGTAADGAAAGLDALSAALASGEGDGKKLTEALGLLGLTTKDAVGVLLSLGDDPKKALRDLARQAGFTGDQMEILASAVDDTDSSGETLETFLRGAAQDMGFTRDEAKALAAALLPTAEAMEEVQDQGEKTDLDEMVRGFLASNAASSDLRQELLAQAEANTGLKRTGDELQPLYIEYVRLLNENRDALGETTPAVEDLTSSLGTQTDVLVELGERLPAVTLNQNALRNEFELTADAANAMREAFDAVFGAYLGMDEANSNLRAGAEQLDEVLKENGATLDETTEAGRNNRDQIRQQVEGIFSYVEAAVAAGDSTDAARAKVDFLTAGLKDQLRQAGFTTAQVDEYLRTLGLTPDNVTTAIELLSDDVARQKVQDVLDAYQNVPDELQTQIQALIDEGAYDAAWRRLQDLSLPREVIYRTSVRGGLGAPVASASGRFVRGGSNLLTTVGELAGRRGDEVILPLGNEGRMNQLLANPRVGRPILEALAGMGAKIQPGSGGVNLTVHAGAFTDGHQVGRIIAQYLKKYERGIGGPGWRE